VFGGSHVAASSSPFGTVASRLRPPGTASRLSAADAAPRQSSDTRPKGIKPGSGAGLAAAEELDRPARVLPACVGEHYAVAALARSIWAPLKGGGKVVDWNDDTSGGQYLPSEVGPRPPLTTRAGGAARNQRIADLAEPISAGTDGLLFLPYLHGERSPVWDVAASAAYTGLRSTHGLGHLVRAALEGVAFNLRQIRDASPSPHDPTRALRASGGPTGMPLWNSIKASVLHTPLAIMEERNSAALGAAILAAVGAGSFSTPAAAMAEMTRMSEIVEPVEGMVNAYDHAFDRYSTIYPALTNSQSTKIRSAGHAS
jgi:sugar (pentulose or hexulose) kinase